MKLADDPAMFAEIDANWDMSCARWVIASKARRLGRKNP